MENSTHLVVALVAIAVLLFLALLLWIAIRVDQLVRDRRKTQMPWWSRAVLPGSWYARSREAPAQHEPLTVEELPAFRFEPPPSQPRRSGPPDEDLSNPVFPVRSQR